MKEKSLEKLRAVVSRLLVAAAPTKWTCTALPLRTQYENTYWLYSCVYVRANWGAGRTACVQKV